MLRSNTIRTALVRLREGSRPLLPRGVANRMPPAAGRILRLNAGDADSESARVDRCEVVFSRASGPQARPRPLGGYPARWEALENSAPPRRFRQFVARIKHASVSGLLPAVVTADGRLVLELSQVLEEPIEQHPTFSRVRLPARTRLPGRTLLLAAGHSGNFYHWMIDTLPRLRLVQRAGYELRAFDHVLVPGASHAFVAESLAQFPELRATRHVVDDTTHFECEELVCPSNLHPAFESSRWAVAYLRRSLRGRTPPNGRRVLLSRAHAGRRRLVNEDVLWNEVLRPQAFDRVFVDGLSLKEQIEVVSGASTLVAPHGAALTHMVFLSQGSSIVELLPDVLPATYFWNLSGAMGHAFRYVVGPSARTGEVGNVVDFEINPADLDACLRDMFAATMATTCAAGVR